MLTLDHGSPDVPYHHDDLIGDLLPAPDPLVVGVVRLDERMVRHAHIFEIPFVLGRWTRRAAVQAGPVRKRGGGQQLRMA